MAKGCFRRTDRVCALCRHWNGAMGSTTIPTDVGRTVSGGDEGKRNLLPENRTDAGNICMFQI